MGIDLELHSGPPRRSGRRREPTLVHASHEHGEVLAGLLSGLPRNTSGKLWTVDPYNDTVFNEQVAEAALREIPGLLSRCTGAAQTAAVRELAAFLEACATTPGSRLVFVGD
ncbi:hypothetical protein [Streptomyces sp. NPDC020489]|uniref:hypothetical protein n=1 Tax=Streptomyces sp. NPDC020489 TaxID=3365077 RepID=UPI0037965CBC